MAARAISSKLPVVYIILAMAISAPGRQIYAMRDFGFMTQETVNTLMSSIQRKFCPGIVIKLP